MSGLRFLSSGTFWAAVAAAAAVFGVVLSLQAVKRANTLQAEDNRLQAAQLDSQLEEGMIRLDGYFAAHPALRPFFFDEGHASRVSQTSDPKMPRSTSVMYEARGTAEMIIDFADDAAAYSRMEQMPIASEERWIRILRPYFRESGVMRQVWRRAHGAYDRVTACFLGAPSGPKVEAWTWETNRPFAPQPKVCS